MTNPDPHPDSLPEADNDRRSDIEQAVSGENRNIESLDESIEGVAPAPEGQGGENGAGGVVKNQDDMAQ
jgi:hypothetical protein